MYNYNQELYFSCIKKTILIKNNNKTIINNSKLCVFYYLFFTKNNYFLTCNRNSKFQKIKIKIHQFNTINYCIKICFFNQYFFNMKTQSIIL